MFSKSFKPICSRSLLSRDKRLPLDTWNTSGLQENVFGNQFSTFDSPGDHPQGIQSDYAENVEQSHEAAGTGSIFTRDDKQNRGTIPMPTLARRPSTMSSTIPVEFPKNSLLGQQRQQISELQFDEFPAPSTFFMLEGKFQNTR